MRAVVVEDDADVRLLMVEVLRLRGHEVEAYTDAATAWGALRQVLPEFLVIDWSPPGSDGLELCRLVRGLPEGQTPEILVVTACRRQTALSVALDAGANDILVKPFDAAQLGPRLAVAERNHTLAVGSTLTRRQADERWHSVYHGLTTGVVVLNKEGRIVDANHSAEELLGLPLPRIKGLVLFDSLWHATRLDGSPLPVAERPGLRALQTGQPQRQVTLRLLRPDGQQRVLMLDVVPLIDADGACTQVMVCYTDLTARVEAEETLRASEQRFRSVTEATHEAIVIADSAGHFVFWNTGAATMFGYSAEEMLGQPLAVVLPERYHEAQRSTLAALNAQGAPRAPDQPLELHGRRKDGSEFPLELSVGTWMTADGPYYSGIMRDLSERQRLEQDLRHQALHDTLTSLPNRTLLQAHLEQALQAGKRTGNPLALLLMDLDRFREINDTLGHHSGDIVLQEVGRRVQSVLRTSDTVARLGGDEFAILLSTLTTPEHATWVADKIIAALARPVIVDDLHLDVGVSIGIAVAPLHGEDSALLLRHADVAMYQAKRSHGGYALYSPGHDQYSPARLALLSSLRLAIERNQLMLHYQPQVDLRTRAVVGVEALLRWKHPERGMIPPGEFIPLAEQSGLIGSLSLWVVEEALRQSVQWRRGGVALRMSVNLSARNVGDPQLTGQVAALLRTYDVGSGGLELEITESTLMADPGGARQVLTELGALGTQFSIDDFGTGYSSLAYLTRLPVHAIKIDQSFVRGLPSDNRAAAIVRSIIALGHNLGLSVVAEGVEHQVALDLLTEIGCDLCQGYYLQRPLSPDDLRGWLSSSPWGLAPARGAS